MTSKEEGKKEEYWNLNSKEKKNWNEFEDEKMIRNENGLKTPNIYTSVKRTKRQIDIFNNLRRASDQNCGGNTFFLGMILSRKKYFPS